MAFNSLPAILPLALVPHSCVAFPFENERGRTSSASAHDPYYARAAFIECPASSGGPKLGRSRRKDHLPSADGPCPVRWRCGPKVVHRRISGQFVMPAHYIHVISARCRDELAVPAYGCAPPGRNAERGAAAVAQAQRRRWIHRRRMGPHTVISRKGPQIASNSCSWAAGRIPFILTHISGHVAGRQFARAQERRRLTKQQHPSAPAARLSPTRLVMPRLNVKRKAPQCRWLRVRISGPPRGASGARGTRAGPSKRRQSTALPPFRSIPSGRISGVSAAKGRK